MGAGVAVFLFVVLPRVSASRAAGPASSASTEPAAPEITVRNEPVQLLQAPEIGSEQPAPPVEVVTAPSTTVGQEEQPVEVAKIEGPKLKYTKGTGKSEKVDHKDLRAPQREQRKERRERAAAAAAQGLAPEEQPAESQKLKPAPHPDRWRIGNRSGTGRTGRGKGKTKDG